MARYKTPRQSFDGARVMNSSLAGSLADQSEIDGLTLDTDDALERVAAVSDGQHLTVGHCTHWYSCDWPLSPADRAAGDLIG
jgi:hypothetical protein